MKHLESMIQRSVATFMRTRFPGTLFTIAPSGMKLSITVARRMKAMGYRAGTPDLIILEPRKGYHGLFIELKAPKGRITPEQEKFLEELSARGYMAVCCFGIHNACRVIEEYLTLGLAK